MRLAQLLVVVIVVSLFSKIFGVANAYSLPPLGTARIINFDGSKLTFSMPENFSKEFPAEPIVEQVSLDDPRQSRLLAQRWWDIKEPGWFGRKLGLVMMRINVIPVAQNSRQLLHRDNYDLSKRMDLILALDEQRRGSASASFDYSDVAILLGEDLSPSYRDAVFNGQKWTVYAMDGDNNLHVDSFNIPINHDYYLEVAFEYAPNNSVAPRQLIFKGREDITQVITKTLHIDYKTSMQSVVEQDWIEQSTKDVMDAHENLLIPALFGDELKRLPKNEIPAKLQKLLN